MIAGCTGIAVARRQLVSRRGSGGSAALLGDARFLRYALSQAFTLGGLMVSSPRCSRR